MARPAQSQPPHGSPRVRLHPDDERGTLAAIRDSREHPEQLRAVTPEALSAWVETGEWPESLG